MISLSKGFAIVVGTAIVDSADTLKDAQREMYRILQEQRGAVVHILEIKPRLRGSQRGVIAL
jgi:hypothetical protein